jgi:hypothetical protein
LSAEQKAAYERLARGRARSDGDKRRHSKSRMAQSLLDIERRREEQEEIRERYSRRNSPIENCSLDEDCQCNLCQELSSLD